MLPARFPIRLLPAHHGRTGLSLVVLGEVLILARLRPLSDFYFPFVWLGYILLLDAAVLRSGRRSLFAHGRTLWLAMFPVSAVFWWIFELFNTVVHNWIYVGGEAYTGVWYVAMASIDFSFVLLGVWTSAFFLDALLPSRGRPRPADADIPEWVLTALFVAGLACLALPLLLPRYAFGLIWGCLYFLLDPINHRLGRPSVIGAVFAGNWRLPVIFALAALQCGFFWEAWNFWSMPKWIYAIPYVNHWHIFEMPLLGWTGYLPFGLELFAMTNFVLPLLGLGTVSLTVPERRAAPMVLETEQATT